MSLHLITGFWGPPWTYTTPMKLFAKSPVRLHFLFWGERQSFWWLLHTWRILPLSKWLITTLSFRPLIGIIPLPNGLFMAYKWGWSKLLTSYHTWDDLPSNDQNPEPTTSTPKISSDPKFPEHPYGSQVFPPPISSDPKFVHQKKGTWKKVRRTNLFNSGACCSWTIPGLELIGEDVDNLKVYHEHPQNPWKNTGFWAI